VTYSDYPPADGKIEKSDARQPAKKRAARPHGLSHRKLRKSQANRCGCDVGTRKRVRIFTATWCGYCKRAKAYLNGHNIAYDELDIEPGRPEAYAQARGGAFLLICGNQHYWFFRKAYEFRLHIR